MKKINYYYITNRQVWFVDSNRVAHVVATAIPAKYAGWYGGGRQMLPMVSS